jgi:DNA-binding NarL/FixJ family response regulator
VAVSPHPTAHPESRHVTTKHYRLFLIEDHALMRRVLRQLLEEEADLEVVAEAESAESALSQLPEVTPDLILTDLSLPGASGLELISWLRAERPELRCLVVTGHTDQFYRAAALAAGAAGYVTKDDPDEVIGAVRRALAAP